MLFDLLPLKSPPFFYLFRVRASRNFYPKHTINFQHKPLVISMNREKLIMRKKFRRKKKNKNILSSMQSSWKGVSTIFNFNEFLIDIFFFRSPLTKKFVSTLAHPLFICFSFYFSLWIERMYRKLKSSTCRRRRHSKATGTMLFQMTLRLAQMFPWISL